MGIGTFLSENNSEEIANKKHAKLAPSIQSGLVMYLSYLAGGFAVLSPYFFLTPNLGSIISVSISLFGLSGIGFFTAYFAKTNYWIEIGKAVLVGGLATFIGIAVGSLEV